MGSFSHMMYFHRICTWLLVDHLRFHHKPVIFRGLTQQKMDPRHKWILGWGRITLILLFRWLFPNYPKLSLPANEWTLPSHERCLFCRLWACGIGCYKWLEKNNDRCATELPIKINSSFKQNVCILIQQVSPISVDYTKCTRSRVRNCWRNVNNDRYCDKRISKEWNDRAQTPSWWTYSLCI